MQKATFALPLPFVAPKMEPLGMTMEYRQSPLGLLNPAFIFVMMN